MFKWIKKLYNIVKYYDMNRSQYQKTLSSLEQKIETLEGEIYERTTVSVDLDDSGDHMVIVAGQYGKHDYVRVYRLRSEEFVQTIKQLEHFVPIGKFAHIDAVPVLKAIIKKGIL